jgi:hydroxymethylpyrimidine pyrophosphatase-like HAD family hydrolase
MYSVRLFATDGDDTLAPHPDEQGVRNLKPAHAVRSAIEKYPHVTFSVITGQSRNDIQDLVDATGIRGPCAYESGYFYFMGGRLLHLSDVRPELIERHPEIAAVDRLRQSLANNGFPQWVSSEHGLYADIMRGKGAMLSIRHYDGRASDFRKSALPAMLGRYPEADAVRQYIESGAVQVTPFRNIATDLKPAIIEKDLPLGIIMKATGAEPRTTMVAGDSGGDAEMFGVVYNADMKDRGYAACPADATREIREIVRAFGNKGIISQWSCEDGAFADILETAARSGWF